MRRVLNVLVFPEFMVFIYPLLIMSSVLSRIVKCRVHESRILIYQTQLSRCLSTLAPEDWNVTVSWSGYVLF